MNYILSAPKNQYKGAKTMSRVNYSTVNDMVDVELAMSRIISQCEMTLDYIGNTSDDCTDKMDNITGFSAVKSRLIMFSASCSSSVAFVIP